jgi:hypothetical protein
LLRFPESSVKHGGHRVRGGFQGAVEFHQRGVGEARKGVVAHPNQKSAATRKLFLLGAHGEGQLFSLLALRELDIGRQRFVAVQSGELLLAAS